MSLVHFEILLFTKCPEDQKHAIPIDDTRAYE